MRAWVLPRCGKKGSEVQAFLLGRKQKQEEVNDWQEGNEECPVTVGRVFAELM